MHGTCSHTYTPTIFRPPNFAQAACAHRVPGKKNKFIAGGLHFAGDAAKEIRRLYLCSHYDTDDILRYFMSISSILIYYWCDELYSMHAIVSDADSEIISVELEAARGDYVDDEACHICYARAPASHAIRDVSLYLTWWDAISMMKSGCIFISPVRHYYWA